MGTSRSAGSSEYAWNFSFPLLTNRFFMWDIFKVFSISGIIGSLLLTVMFAIARNTHAIIPMLKLLCGVIAFLVVITILVCVIWFGNRFHALFVVNREGALVEIARNRDKAMNRLAVVLGILQGNLAATGTGLIAMSDEAKSITWKDVKTVNFYPEARVISIKNSWRVVVRLYCSKENYEQIAAAVKEYSCMKT